MYYRDQYGNVVEYSPGGTGMYSNAIHPGGIGYHPLTREDFGVQDIKTWFDTYKMWFLYALLIMMILWIVMWMFKGKSKKSNASVFY
jgi:hypothetical protein